MKIDTIDEAQSLVGTTWECNGQRRTITRITDLRMEPVYCCILGYVHWSRPGGKERKQSVWLPYFRDWLAKAKQISHD